MKPGTHMKGIDAAGRTSGRGRDSTTCASTTYVIPVPGDAKITFAEAHRGSGEDRASPRVAVFLQHADLAVLRRLLDRTVVPAIRGRSVSEVRCTIIQTGPVAEGRLGNFDQLQTKVRQHRWPFEQHGKWRSP